jgi:hypothetical protein
MRKKTRNRNPALSSQRIRNGKFSAIVARPNNDWFSPTFAPLKIAPRALSRMLEILTLQMTHSGGLMTKVSTNKAEIKLPKAMKFASVTF